MSEGIYTREHSVPGDDISAALAVQLAEREARIAQLNAEIERMKAFVHAFNAWVDGASAFGVTGRIPRLTRVQLEQWARRLTE